MTTTSDSATLTASVFPNGVDTHVFFVWGTDPTFKTCTQTPAWPGKDIGAGEPPIDGSSPVVVSVQITGLTAWQFYYCAAQATNYFGTVTGEATSFRIVT